MAKGKSCKNNSRGCGTIIIAFLIIAIITTIIKGLLAHPWIVVLFIAALIGSLVMLIRLYLKKKSIENDNISKDDFALEKKKCIIYIIAFIIIFFLITIIGVSCDNKNNRVETSEQTSISENSIAEKNEKTTMITTTTSSSKTTTTTSATDTTTTIITTITEPPTDPPTEAPTEPPTDPPTEPPTPTPTEPPTEAEIKIVHFILNTDSNCVHINASCTAAEKILPENYSEIDIPENELSDYSGQYWACGKCSNIYKDELPKFE